MWLPSLLILMLVLVPCACQQLVIPQAALDPNATCVPFNTSNYCADIIPAGAMIYVNSTYTQADAQARAGSYLTQITPVQAVNPTCASALYNFMCTSVFMPCENYVPAGSLSYALPNMSCAALCDSTNIICAPVYQAFGAPPQPCAPDIAYDFSAVGGPSLFQPACAQGYLSSNQTTCPTSCPKPDFQDVNNCCQLKCPIGRALYGESQWTALVTTFFVLSWLSFILLIPTLFLYVANPALRTFPGSLIIAVGFGIWFGDASFIMSTGNTDKFACPYPPPSVLSTACTVQGLGVMFWAHFALHYWVCLNVITCSLLLVRHVKSFLDLLTRWQWAFGLIVLLPLTATIASALTSKNNTRYAVGFTGIIPWCSIFEPAGLYNFYAIWSVILIGIGTICWLISMFMIMKMYRTTHKLDLRMHAAIVLFEILCLISVGLFVFNFMAQYPYVHEQLQIDIQLYLSGQISTPPSISFGSMYALVFGSTILGILFSVVFGLRRVHLDFIRGHVFGGTSTTIHVTSAEVTGNRSGSSVAGSRKSQYSIGSDEMEQEAVETSRF